jgi:hypothetical protein
MYLHIYRTPTRVCYLIKPSVHDVRGSQQVHRTSLVYELQAVNDVRCSLCAVLWEYCALLTPWGIEHRWSYNWTQFCLRAKFHNVIRTAVLVCEVNYKINFLFTKAFTFMPIVYNLDTVPQNEKVVCNLDVVPEDETVVCILNTK